MRKALVLQAWGRVEEYRRCLLALHSFFLKTRRPWDEFEVHLFTDRPDWFATATAAYPMHMRLLTLDKIRAMRGDIDFVHRMKIAMIEEVAGELPDRLLYVDSDTFFLQPPEQVYARITPTRRIMHLAEYPFSSMEKLELPAGAPFQAVHRRFTEAPFRLPDGRTLRVDLEGFSWNAGVIGLHRDAPAPFATVYALTEALYPETRNHASEQYAFSIALAEQGPLAACDDLIYHYWYRVKKALIDQWLKTRWPADSGAPALADPGELERFLDSLPYQLDNCRVALMDHALQAFHRRDLRAAFSYLARALSKGACFDGVFLRHVAYQLREIWRRRRRG